MTENNNMIYTMRFRFKRTAELRFLSHLDQQTTFQRAFRRAAVPLAYSGGFHPHPKMAFAQAMSVGMTSECEYGDVQLTEPVDPDDFMDRFNAVMPAGLAITAAKLYEGKLSSLTAAVTRADYVLTVEYAGDIDQRALDSAVAVFLAEPEILIQKRNKKGRLKSKDIKPFILSLSGEVAGDHTIVFHLCDAFINQATVKPVQVVAAFADHSGFHFSETESWRLHRKNLVIGGNENAENL